MSADPGFGFFTPRLGARDALPVLAIAGIVLFSFWPCLANGFVDWDDPDYILRNPLLRSLAWSNLRAIFSTIHVGNFHPLTTLSNAVEFRLWGLNPWYFHAGNLIIHLFNAVLVYILVRGLVSGRRWAFLTTLLFAVHPLKVESVAWISERKDLLYACFYLISLILYDFFLATGATRFRWAALLTFGCSLLSKGQGITFPLVAIGLDVMRGRRPALALLGEKWPFLLLAGISGVITVIGQQQGETIIQEIPLLHSLCVACFGIVFYVSRLIWPFPLCHLYPYPEQVATSLPATFATAPFLLLGFVLGLRMLAREFRFAGPGGGFFLVTLLPVLQIVPYAGAFAADRYTYLPLVGAALLVGEMLEKCWNRLGASPIGNRILAVVLAASLLGLSLASRDRCLVWSDGVTLWSDLVAKYPGYGRGYLSRADCYLQAGRFDLARQDLEKARLLVTKPWQVHLALGNLALREGNPAEAGREFERVRTLAPGNVEVCFPLGLWFLSQDRPEEAIGELSRLLERYPSNWEALSNRAIAQVMLRRWPEAQRDIEAAIGLFPNHPGLEQNRARILAAMAAQSGRGADRHSPGP